jgi:hypothetical protein
MWGYLMLLMDKLVGHVLPVRFVAFGLVGAVGVLLPSRLVRGVRRLLRWPVILP